PSPGPRHRPPCPSPFPRRRRRRPAPCRRRVPPCRRRRRPSPWPYRTACREIPWPGPYAPPSRRANPGGRTFSLPLVLVLVRLLVEMEPVEQLAGLLVGLLDRVVEAPARR